MSARVPKWVHDVINELEFELSPERGKVFRKFRETALGGCGDYDAARAAMCVYLLRLNADAAGLCLFKPGGLSRGVSDFLTYARDMALRVRSAYLNEDDSKRRLVHLDNYVSWQWGWLCFNPGIAGSQHVSANVASGVLRATKCVASKNIKMRDAIRNTICAYKGACASGAMWGAEKNSVGLSDAALDVGRAATKGKWHAADGIADELLRVLGHTP